MVKWRICALQANILFPENVVKPRQTEEKSICDPEGLRYRRALPSGFIFITFFVIKMSIFAYKVLKSKTTDAIIFITRMVIKMKRGND